MITFASGFGLAYSVAMKGVVLSRTNGWLVDVAHDLPRQDVRAATFWFRETLPYFSPTVHFVVVNPGTGTDRHTVVLRVGDHVFIGPDNGVLHPPARRVAVKLDDDVPVEAYETDIPNPESTAFHGRGVFVSAAVDAHVAGASAFRSVDRFEPIPVGSLSECRFSEATVSDDSRGATGEVLVVDDFGNCITNVPGAFICDAVGEAVWANGESVPIGRTFEAVICGGKLVTVGNHDNIECNVNHGRGDKVFGLTPGDRVEFQVG